MTSTTPMAPIPRTSGAENLVVKYVGPTWTLVGKACVKALDLVESRPSTTRKAARMASTIVPEWSSKVEATEYNPEMTDERKRPARFWVAVTVAVLLAYPAFLGPCCWLSSRTGLGAGFVSSVYKPIFRQFPVVYFGEHDRPPMLKMLTWYSELWAMDGWSWGPHPSVVQEIRPDMSSPIVFQTFAVWDWKIAARSR